VKRERFAVIGSQALIGLPPTPAGGREVHCCNCGALLARTLPTYLLNSPRWAPVADGRLQWAALALKIVMEFEPGLQESDLSAAGRRVVKPTARALKRRTGPRERGGISRPRRILVTRIGPEGTVTNRRVSPDKVDVRFDQPHFDFPDPLATMVEFDGTPFEIYCLKPACEARQTVNWSRRERTPG
jgi:hypothetical protein